MITERKHTFSVGDSKKVYIYSGVTFNLYTEIKTESIPLSIVEKAEDNAFMVTDAEYIYYCTLRPCVMFYKWEIQNKA